MGKESDRKLVVLSLFDVMSCGQTALHELGMVPYVYYASEIDKHAIGQTQLNFSNTVQLGSVVDVDVSKLEHVPNLLIGGSPCQSFSFAGKRKGMATKCDVEIYTLEKYLKLKAEGFEFEGQSYLFWEYMRILNDIRKINPDVKFLLENVEMGNKWERVLSEAIGLYGVHINSALVSAQNRKRIYWTNIRTRQEGLFGELHSDIPQPKDEGILLKDILEKDVAEKYYLSEKVVENLIEHKERHKEQGHGFGAVFHDPNKKMQALKVGGKGIDDLVCVSIIPCDYRHDEGVRMKTDGKTGTLLGRARNDESCGQLVYIEQRERGFNKGGTFEEKTPTLSSNSWEQNNLLHNDYRIRRLTPTECARLQTIPDWYKWNSSDTQQYRMLGNGWTIEVIKHILSFL